MPNPYHLRLFAIFSAAIILALPPSSVAAEEASPEASVRAAVEKGFGTRVQVRCYLNPCVLAGDFDGVPLPLVQPESCVT